MPIKRKFLILIILLLIASLSILYFLTRKHSDNLQLSGRLEGYETDIAPKVGGRVDYVVAREGTAVHKGELIVRLDDSDLKARLKSLTALVEVAKQQEKQARLQLDVVRNQVTQAQLTAQQSTGETQGTIQQARASVSVAQAQLLQAQQQLNQANSDLAQADTDLRRYCVLARNGSIPRHTCEQAQTRYDIARQTQQLRIAGVTAARRQVEQAQALLIQANAAQFNPAIRTQQIALTQTQLAQAQTQYEAARANLTRAQADRQEVLAQIAYLYVKSPIDGIIIARAVEPGEIVSAGKTLLTLLNLNTVYMRGYIPEGQIGLVRVGQQAKVYLDSAPDKPLNAKVSQIDIEASFTPENIYFRQDRVKQVFGVKLNIINSQGYAKPGMPADAEILISNNKRNKNAKW